MSILYLKINQSEKHYSIDIYVHAPELQIISCTMDDATGGNGDNIPDPGETFNLIFKVRNQGSSNIEGQFNISTLANEISIVEPSVKSGVLKFGEVATIPVTVKLSESAASGSLISLAATLDCNPYIVTKDFSFKSWKNPGKF